MLISVITINYNNKDGLNKTIQSIIGQTYTGIEYIVIDGGSTDGSVDIITANSQNINYWVSEKDNGIYDAMNKGIKQAKGEYLLFLNSGDYFYTNESVAIFASQHDDKDIVYGDLQVVETDSTWVKNYPSKLSFKYFLQDTLPHPACFIKRSAFEKVGLYDTSMQIAADWAFFIKAICLHNLSYKHLDQVISGFYNNGVSSHAHNQPLIKKEKDKYLQQEFALFINDFNDNDEMIQKYHHLKNSRLRKYLSYFFKQLKL